MKKMLIVMLALLLASTTLYAQNFAVGVRGGVALGVHQEADAFMLESGDTKELKINPNAAVYGAYMFTGNMGVQLEANVMINQGTKFSNSGMTVEMTYTSLDIPVLFRFNFSFGLGIMAGPHISIPLGKLKMKASSGWLSLSGDVGDMTGFSFGATAGLFYGFPLGPGRLIADLRFIFDFTAAKVKGGGITLDFLKRRALALTIGYEFRF
ncbi:MAG: PorT family protein [Treponema sp.]|jgi:hypothetical protein|nr:PorT family protein [Treponema sp.]